MLIEIYLKIIEMQIRSPTLEVSVKICSILIGIAHLNLRAKLEVSAH